MNSKLFNESQLFSIGTALDRGNLPVKWAYLTQIGNNAWAQMEKERNQTGSSFVDGGMFEKGISTYLSELGNPEEVVMIDIGGGAGITVEPIIRMLVDKSIKVQYSTFDISGEMITRCKEQISSIVPFTGYLIDVDEGGVGAKIREIKRKQPNTPILVTVLGSTIGNFANARALLKQIEDGLSLQDRILVGGQLYTPGQENKLVRLYREDRTAHALLTATLHGLDVNFRGKSDFRWNTRENMVEGFIEVGEDADFSLGNQKIHYNKGDEIRLLETRKFDVERFLGARGDMRIASIVTDVRAGFCQAMYAPVRR